jgi:acetolactate synthase I/II/III large subunit
MINISQQLVSGLKELGVSVVFGMPGGASLPILAALQQENVDFVLVRHEGSAGFMADAVAQYTNNIGVCLSTLGPGATNLISGIAGSYLERTRVLGIVGQCNSELENIYTHQILDQRTLFSPITKYYTQMHFKRGEDQLLLLFRQLTQGDARPVICEISKNVATAPCQPLNIDLPPERGIPNLENALDLIAQSQFPVLFVGCENLSDELSETLHQWSEEQNIPVLLTYRAKGVVPENSPWNIGCAGLSPKVDRIQQEFLDRCDLIISIGLDPVELRPNWLCGWDTSKPLLHISQSEYSDLLSSITVHLCGNMNGIVERLSLAKQKSTFEWAMEDVEEHRLQWMELFNDGEQGPANSIRAIQNNLPSNCVATLDVGSHRITATHIWECMEPRTLLQSNGFSSMGVGLPMAIAVKIVDPERPVVAICGDMGLWMSMGELGIIQERQLDLVVVYLCDQKLSLIDIKQKREHFLSFGVSFENPDVEHLAAAFGGVGHRTFNTSELSKAVAVAHAEGGLHIIEAHINADFYQQQM